MRDKYFNSLKPCLNECDSEINEKYGILNSKRVLIELNETNQDDKAFKQESSFIDQIHKTTDNENLITWQMNMLLQLAYLSKNKTYEPSYIKEILNKILSFSYKDDRIGSNYGDFEYETNDDGKITHKMKELEKELDITTGYYYDFDLKKVCIVKLAVAK